MGETALSELRGRTYSIHGTATKIELAALDLKIFIASLQLGHDLCCLLTQLAPLLPEAVLRPELTKDRKTFWL